MRIRLYLDEDTMDRDMLLAFRVRGTDITTALGAGMMRRDDADHLEFATSQGRALYSFNVGDYCSLHTEYSNQNKHLAGIILASQQQYSVGEQMRRLLKTLGAISADEIRDSILFLSAWGQ